MVQKYSLSTFWGTSCSSLTLLSKRKETLESESNNYLSFGSQVRCSRIFAFWNRKSGLHHFHKESIFIVMIIMIVRSLIIMIIDHHDHHYDRNAESSGVVAAAWTSFLLLLITICKLRSQNIFIIIAIFTIIVSIISIREAVMREKCSFFELCSKGGGGQTHVQKLCCEF